MQMLVPNCSRRYIGDSNLDYFEFTVAEIIAFIIVSLERSGDA